MRVPYEIDLGWNLNKHDYAFDGSDFDLGECVSAGTMMIGEPIRDMQFQGCADPVDVGTTIYHLTDDFELEYISVYLSSPLIWKIWGKLVDWHLPADWILHFQEWLSERIFD